MGVWEGRDVEGDCCMERYEGICEVMKCCLFARCLEIARALHPFNFINAHTTPCPTVSIPSRFDT